MDQVIGLRQFFGESRCKDGTRPRILQRGDVEKLLVQSLLYDRNEILAMVNQDASGHRIGVHTFHIFDGGELPYDPFEVSDIAATRRDLDARPPGHAMPDIRFWRHSAHLL